MNRVLAPHEETSSLNDIYEMPEPQTSTSLGFMRSSSLLTSVPMSTIPTGIASQTPQGNTLHEELHRAMLEDIQDTLLASPYPPCYTEVLANMDELLQVLTNAWREMDPDAIGYDHGAI